MHSCMDKCEWYVLSRHAAGNEQATGGVPQPHSAAHQPARGLAGSHAQGARASAHATAAALHPHPGACKPPVWFLIVGTSPYFSVHPLRAEAYTGTDSICAVQVNPEAAVEIQIADDNRQALFDFARYRPGHHDPLHCGMLPTEMYRGLCKGAGLAG